jgi:hypothetical protein
MNKQEGALKKTEYIEDFCLSCEHSVKCTADGAGLVFLSSGCYLDLDTEKAQREQSCEHYSEIIFE